MSETNVLYSKVGGVVLTLLAIAGALYGAYSHGVTVTDLRWKAALADHQALQAKALASATNANRAEEQRRQKTVNQVGSDARKQTRSATADADSADAVGERLREQAGKLAAGASCAPVDPGVAERGASATRAAMVLSDLFQRADKRAGELARAYDGARIAGEACERAYRLIQGDPK